MRPPEPEAQVQFLFKIQRLLSEGGFVATGELPAKEMDLKIPDLVGPVTVTPHADGPLQIKGAVEVETGTGRAVTRVKGAFFCRCGHSANKPFCDGSHKAAGFKA